MRIIYQLFKLLVVCLLCQNASAQTKNVIYPSAIWPDQNGNHIQAHGGGILKMGRTYYWYGEQRAKGLDTNFRYVGCYSSKDLVNWKFKGNALKLAKPDEALQGTNWVLERPKVYYNKKTRKYVMYMHLDGRELDKTNPDPSVVSNYGYARVAVATSDKPTGPFKYVRSFRPLGKESRDIGQFVDDDGTPYLIFESRPSKGFYIASLSEDYLDVVKEVCFIKSSLEGGAIVNYQGLYYVIGSELSGWAPNPNKYATSKSLAGPWSEFKHIAPPETNTYHSQSTMLVKVVGSKKETVIFMADQWKPDTQWDSRYLWMPLEIGEGKLWVPTPSPWKLDIKTGLTEILNK